MFIINEKRDLSSIHALNKQTEFESNEKFGVNFS